MDFQKRLTCGKSGGFSNFSYLYARGVSPGIALGCLLAGASSLSSLRSRRACVAVYCALASRGTLCGSRLLYPVGKLFPRVYRVFGDVYVCLWLFILHYQVRLHPNHALERTLRGF